MVLGYSTCFDNTAKCVTNKKLRFNSYEAICLDGGHPRFLRKGIINAKNNFKKVIFVSKVVEKDT